ncbi:MAG: TolB family protein [Gemmatimonadaceae bacterium]
MNKTIGEVWLRRRILVTSAFLALVSTACMDDVVRTGPTSTYLNVRVTASGGDLDLNGYSVFVDEQRRSIVNGDIQSFIVSTGSHVVGLTDVASNCSVVGENPRSVSVEPASIAQVVFEVACAQTGVAITTRTTGVDIPDMYGVSVNDQSVPNMSSNGNYSVSRLPAGPNTLTLLVPDNCTVSGGARLVVDVISKSVISVRFDVTCAPVARLEKIAYAADVVGNRQGERSIDLVKLDGAGAITLQTGDAPSWSPDGKKLVFSAALCDYYYYYYYNNSCVGGLLLLDPELGNVSTPAASLSGLNPSWAPTGDRIVFEIGGSNGAELRVLHLSSGTAVPLPISGPRSKEQPSWSPDGRQIVFVCKWDANIDLCIVNSDGSGLARLTNDPLLKRHPAWSPDGRTIAFTRYPVDRTDPAAAEIILFDLASRQVTTLTNGLEPAWSPDGTRLVFAGADGLFLIRADGTNRTRLTTGPHHVPAWRP